MSFTKKDRKIQSFSGKGFPNRSNDGTQWTFARVIADALHREFGDTHSAIKTVAIQTGANERAVKNWFMATNGPSGKHLVDLMRMSDEVLVAVLIMSDRRDLVVAKKLRDSRQLLIQMLDLVQQLQDQQLSDPREIILATFCSASFTYPRDRDPTQSIRRIAPLQSAHLTRVVLMELEANGFEIVKKTG